MKHACLSPSPTRASGAAAEVAQLYAADTATGVTLPAQQLVGFARLELEPGASKTVTFDVPMSVLAYTGVSGDLVMEPGPVELSAGGSSADKVPPTSAPPPHSRSGERRAPSAARIARSSRSRRSGRDGAGLVGATKHEPQLSQRVQLGRSDRAAVRAHTRGCRGNPVGQPAITSVDSPGRRRHRARSPAPQASASPPRGRRSSSCVSATPQPVRGPRRRRRQ